MLRYSSTKHLESLAVRMVDTMDSLGLSVEELKLAVEHPDYRIISMEAFSKGISWAQAHYQLMGQGVLSCDQVAAQESPVSLVNFPEHDHAGFARDHRLWKKFGG